LERNANRDVALTWKESIYKRGAPRILPSNLSDLERSWEYFKRADLHKLSAVDATSFVIMRREQIRLAFTFDHHFAVVGFRLVA
jgi:predicted nucleic acid-binding protein